MPESHTLGARGCVGILENNKSKATMILNVARMCLRLSIQWSMCLRIASAVQVIRCLAPNVLSRPILRKTLTLQPCLNQLWLSRLLYSAWISGYAMARVFTQFMTQQNGLNFLLKIHINSILRILQDSSIQQQKKLHWHVLSLNLLTTIQYAALLTTPNEEKKASNAKQVQLVLQPSTTKFRWTSTQILRPEHTSHPASCAEGCHQQKSSAPGRRF